MAALGALAFGHVEFSVTTSIIIGSIPAVIVGSSISSRAPDRYIRPAITFVIFASGLKYVGLGTTALGWVLCATLLAAAVIWLFYVRPWQSGAPMGVDDAVGDQPDASVRSHRRVSTPVSSRTGAPHPSTRRDLDTTPAHSAAGSSRRSPPNHYFVSRATFSAGGGFREVMDTSERRPQP